MSINYYSVQNDLEENGWQLLSTEYKNLKSLLQMKCPAGHEVELTYENWRKYKRCEICLAADPYKMKNKSIPPKDVNKKRLLALDAATNTTGYSLYDGTELIDYGIFKTNSNDDTTIRINQVKHWLQAAIEEWHPDFLAIENVQLQSYNGNQNSVQVKTYNALARLQGVILDTLFENHMNCGLVYPTEWRSYCGVTGGRREEQKRAAQNKVKMWYRIDCTEDEADAICIGKFFVSHMREEEKRNNFWGEDI